MAMVLGLTLATAAPAGAVTITEYPVGSGIPGENLPTFIASSPTGRLWFTDVGEDWGVRQMSTAGQTIGSEINEPAAEAPSAPTSDLAFDADGTLVWSVDDGTNPGNLDPPPWRVTRKPGGQLEFQGPSEIIRDPTAFVFSDGVVIGAYRDTDTGGFAICPTLRPCFGEEVVDSRITDLTLDASGQIWAAQPEGDVVRRVNAAENGYDLAVPFPGGSTPYRVALGPDGNLWVTAYGSEGQDGSQQHNGIVRVSPSGATTVFPLPPDRGPTDIAVGPDGALWFTELLASRIGRITVCGEYSSYPLPEPGVEPWGIVAGADGALWFTEYGSPAVGRLVPDPPRNDCPAPPAGPAPPGGRTLDATKPALGQLTLSRRSFRAASGGASTSAKRRKAPPTGAVVTFTLSEPASVAFAVDRQAPGRRVGGACVKQKPANAGKRRCQRWEKVKGSFALDGTAGMNRMTFRGRVGARSLQPGSHRLTGVATDAAGNASLPQSVGFTIVP